MTTSEEQLKEINNLHIIIDNLSEEIKAIKSILFTQKKVEINEVLEYEYESESFFTTFIELLLIELL